MMMTIYICARAQSELNHKYVYRQSWGWFHSVPSSGLNIPLPYGRAFQLNSYSLILTFCEGEFIRPGGWVPKTPSCILGELLSKTLSSSCHKYDLVAQISKWLGSHIISHHPWEQGSWGLHGAHLGPTGPRWALCGPREPCYRGRSAR